MSSPAKGIIKPKNSGPDFSHASDDQYQKVSFAQNDLTHHQFAQEVHSIERLDPVTTRNPAINQQAYDTAPNGEQIEQMSFDQGLTPQVKSSKSSTSKLKNSHSNTKSLSKISSSKSGGVNKKLEQAQKNEMLLQQMSARSKSSMDEDINGSIGTIGSKKPNDNNFKQ